MRLFTILIICMVFSFAGIVGAKDYEVSKKAGDLNVLIKIDRNPPVVGKNNVEIAIADSAGKPVTDAKVVLAYSMPPMSGMAPMNYKADAEIKGNVYKTQLNYSMAGSWNNEVRITRAGKTSSLKFTIDAK